MWTLTLVLVLAPAPCQAEGKPFEDPAPPKVHLLGPVDEPAAEPYPELEFRAAPKALAAGALSEDWPTFLGPRRDARSRETHLLREWPQGGPRLVWAMERGLGYACPVIKNGRLVFTHRVGDALHVDCLDAETGERYWRRSRSTEYRDRFVKNGGQRSTPTIAGERVYVNHVDNRLECFDLATGRTIWERDIASEFEIPTEFFGVVSSPIAAGGLLIQNIGAPGGPSVAAFDLASGRLAWGAGTRWGASCASPVRAMFGGRARIFVLAGGDSRPPVGGLMVMDPATGALAYEHPFRSKVYLSVAGASPVVGGDTVFLTDSYGAGTAAISIDEDGSFAELWKNRHIGVQFSTPVYEDGYLYAIDGKSGRAGAVICIDPKTGQEIARTDLDWDETYTEDGEEKTHNFSLGEGSLLAADGDFLCLGDSGHLLWLELSPAGAQVVSRTWLFGASESWTPLVVSRGLLYVCQNNRERFGDEPARLLCYDLRRAE